MLYTISDYIKKNTKNIIYIYYFIAMFSFFVPGQYVSIVFPIRKLVPLLGILLIFFKGDITLNIKKTIPFLILYLLASANGIKKEDMIMIGILAVLFKDDSYKFMLFNFVFLFLYLTITTPLSAAGLISGKIFNDARGLRHAFFFNHPNLFGLATIACLSSFFYICTIKQSKVFNISFVLLSIFSILFLNNIVMTRMNTIVVIVLLVCFIIWLPSSNMTFLKKIIDFFNKYEHLLIIITPLLVLLMSFMFGYGLPGMDKVNHLLSGRPFLQYNAITKYGFPLFGKNMSFTNGDGNTLYEVLDSGFISYIFNYGAVFFYYLLFSLTNLAKKVNLKKTHLIIPVLVFCLSGVTENLLFCFVHNPFIVILVSHYLFDNQKEKLCR